MIKFTYLSVERKQTADWMINYLKMVYLKMAKGFLKYRLYSLKKELETSFSSLFQGKWKLQNPEPSTFGDLIYKHSNYNHTQRSTQPRIKTTH